MAKQGEAAAGPGATHNEQVSAGAANMGKSQTGAHPRQAQSRGSPRASPWCRGRAEGVLAC